LSGRAWSLAGSVDRATRERVVGVQQWAEIRRVVLVEGCSQREVAMRLGLALKTVARLLGKLTRTSELTPA
jgi:transposase